MGEEGNFSRKTFSWSEGSEWALGQASLLEGRSLEESKAPWRERGAELSLPSCLLAGQTLAAHRSPDVQMLSPHCHRNPGDLGVGWRLQLLGKCSPATGIRTSRHFLEGP